MSLPTKKRKITTKHSITTKRSMNYKPKSGQSLADFPLVATQFLGMTDETDTRQPHEITRGTEAFARWQCNNIYECGCKHEWTTRIVYRTGKKPSGCPFCARKQVCKHNSLEANYPDVAAQFMYLVNRDGTKAKKNLRPHELSQQCNKRARWQCTNIHECGCKHEWTTRISHRTGKNRSNCPFCARQKICEHTSLQAEYPEISAEFMYLVTSNARDTPSDDKRRPHELAKGSSERARWKCSSCKHEWTTKICDRTSYSTGCPKCNLSHMERDMRTLLTTLQSGTQSTLRPHLWTIQEIFHDYRLQNGQRADLYVVLKSDNDRRCVAIIEMDGLQHFEPVDWFGGQGGLEKTKERDARKDAWCLEQGYCILRIDDSVVSTDYSNHVCQFFTQVLTSQEPFVEYVGSRYVQK